MDYDILRETFGQTTTYGSGGYTGENISPGSSNSPEPSTFVLLAGAGIGMGLYSLSRGRRNNRNLVREVSDSAGLMAERAVRNYMSGRE